MEYLVITAFIAFIGALVYGVIDALNIKPSKH
jgi:hypothetical protein